MILLKWKIKRYAVCHGLMCNNSTDDNDNSNGNYMKMMMIQIVTMLIIIVTMIIILTMISKNNETTTNTTIDKNNKNTNSDNDNGDKTKKIRTLRRITVKSCRFYKCYLLTWNPAWPWPSITDTPILSFYELKIHVGRSLVFSWISIIMFDKFRFDSSS